MQAFVCSHEKATHVLLGRNNKDFISINLTMLILIAPNDNSAVRSAILIGVGKPGFTSLKIAENKNALKIERNIKNKYQN